MRILSLLASALLLVLGLSLAPTAKAYGPDTRIWVSIGDVVFSAGHPYHRHLHHPLHVVHGGPAPRYYYRAPPPPRPHHYRHRAPVKVYAPGVYPHYYAHGHHHRPPPPPPRPGYPRYRPGYGR